VLQKEVVPEIVPDFAEVDPFDPDAPDSIGLEYPYWLKPVKSASSYLGFRIHDRHELQQSLAIIRDKIGRFAEPFNYILGFADLPADIAHVDGNHCIAEDIISSGEQCTLEGYVYDNNVYVYGVVDSLRGGRHQSCFTRYQYPSTLPTTVQQRMIGATVKLLQHLQYNNGPFNIEYYWNPRKDRIWLLEINTRISKSHCPLFKMVDGEYHHAVMIALALGEAPDFPHREGYYKMAAKFMLRRYRDGTVTRVPSAQDINRVKERFPDTEVLLHVKPGQRLSHLPDQDSYSYEIAVIFMGGDSEQQLEENYHAALEMLPFVIDKQDTDTKNTLTTPKESV
jgi:biotin carboxylase